VGDHLLGRRQDGVAEDVGMPPHQLAGDALQDLGQGEGAPLLSDLHLQ